MCTRDERTHQETRYYLSSVAPNAVRLQHVIRRHWAIETELHWVLDVVFDEDQSRIRMGYTAENSETLRKLALSVLKQDRTSPTAGRMGRPLSGAGTGPSCTSITLTTTTQGRAMARRVEAGVRYPSAW